MERRIRTTRATGATTGHARSGRMRRPAGFLLAEALVALSLLGTGLLPIAALAPRALAWRQDLARAATASRAAAEAAELFALCWPRCAHGPLPPSRWPALQPTLGDAASMGAPSGNCAAGTFGASALPARPCLPAPRWCASVQQGSITCPPGPAIVMVAALEALADSLARASMGPGAAPPPTALRAVALWTGR